MFLDRLSWAFSTHAIHIDGDIDAFIVRAIDLTYFVMPVLQWTKTGDVSPLIDDRSLIEMVHEFKWTPCRPV